MKIILGINAFHADSSACIIVNNRLVAAIEEERITRIKHDASFPINAILECLKISNLNENQITDIAFNTNPLSNLISKGLFFLKNFKLNKNNNLERLRKKNNLSKIIKQKLHLNKNVKFHFIEHHKSHIASAYYPSNLSSANGLSIDGSGDFVTFALAECNDRQIKIVEKINFPHSLGIFYHAMTQFLGYDKYGDEYKIMGLAAYGKPVYYDKILDNLFVKKKDQFFELNLDYFNHHHKNFKYIADENLIIDTIYNEKLKNLFSNELNENNFQINFAASVQKIYEYFFQKIIIKIKEKNFSKNLVFAGGCALNSSANKVLTENKNYFEKTFIPFAPGDNGGSIGAALVVGYKYFKQIENLNSPYLGKKFSNDEIYPILSQEKYSSKISFEYVPNNSELFQLAAKKIANSEVIGWFQENMEFGPRALGNRSILADPRNPNMKDIINKKIKRRESFRPFAPSVLKDKQKYWFKSNFFNPYMSSVSNVIEEKKKLVPSITHIDGTARLQSVCPKEHQRYYKLLNTFFEISNVPIILNTSFNENEPIVMKPEEAIDCLIRTDMDGLFLENYFVQKK